MEHEPKEVIKTLIEVLCSAEQLHQENESAVHLMDNEYNDLTHALELIHFNGAQGYKLAKELQKNRKLRRERKNHNRLIKPLLGFMQRNPQFLHELRCCLNEINQTEKLISASGYRPRTQNPVFEEVFGNTKVIQFPGEVPAHAAT